MAQNSPAAHTYSPSSFCTPPEMKSNIGKNASASAPVVQAQGVAGSSSRRKR